MGPYDTSPALLNPRTRLETLLLLTGNSDPTHPSHGLLEIVHTAAEAYPDSIWKSPEWSVELLCKHAKRLQFDGFTLPMPPGDGGAEELRFCVYLHHVR